MARAIEVAGSQALLAQRLKCSQAAVSKWLRIRVPAERAIEIERATGVPRHELRPDLWPQRA